VNGRVGTFRSRLRAWILGVSRGVVSPRGEDMRRYMILTLLGSMAFAGHALAADPQYTTIKMEIDVARPAAAVWSRVGGYCDISKWLDVDCVIKSGDGGIGTVRVLGGGRVTEIRLHAARARRAVLQPLSRLRRSEARHGADVQAALHADVRHLRQGRSGRQAGRHGAAPREVRRRAQEDEDAGRSALMSPSRGARVAARDGSVSTRTFTCRRPKTFARAQSRMKMSISFPFTAGPVSATVNVCGRCDRRPVTRMVVPIGSTRGSAATVPLLASVPELVVPPRQ